MTVITEQIMDVVKGYIDGYQNRDFQGLWDNVHPDEKERIKNFLQSNNSSKDLETFVFELLDEKFLNLPDDIAIASNIRVNDFDNEYVLIVDEEYNGFYSESFQMKAIPVSIMKMGQEYKVKVYDD